MFKVCPACEGQAHKLGALGALIHYRCQNCGWTFHVRRKPKPKPKGVK